MKHVQRLISILAALLLIPLAVRLLVAALQRRANLSAEHLSDLDSRFADVGGLQMHYKIARNGPSALVLLHGSFLNHFSWREVFTPLSRSNTVIAFDRPAFGLTDRPHPDRTNNPYTPEAQADMVVALLDRLNIQKAVLVGNSTGGTIALLTALRHPERVQGLVLVSAMVYSGYAVSEFPAWLRPVLRFFSPLGRLLISLVMSSLYEKAIRSFWHDKTRVTPQVLTEYRKNIKIKEWDRALWELTLACHALNLDEQLTQITVPVLVITGEQDRTVHTQESIRLAQALPNAELVVIPDCGHVAHEECPEPFINAVTAFIANQKP